ncbi:MAG: GSCFA domain-containing protein [Paludibacter sp.]
MNFQTKVEIPSSDLKITYEDSIMTLGSCFAENIGRKLQQVYFETDINPFGVLYNPISISNSIRLLLKNKPFKTTDLFENRGLWQSFSHSSLFSATTSVQCLENINVRFQKAANTLQKTNYLLITFGTAWVFEDKESGSVVSNCHKLPADNFTRRRLTVDEIVTEYSKLINELIDKLPDLKLIFSVSPIRHWKDGAHENNLNKSILLLAIEALQNQFPNVGYFPAYEIQMDELRDYRFYASDMLHPSDVAIEYIWKRFSDTYFDSTTTATCKEIEQLSADLAHRPLFPESEEYRKFQLHINQKLADLKRKYPFLDTRL